MPFCSFAAKKQWTGKNRYYHNLKVATSRGAFLEQLLWNREKISGADQ
jgi:hypothetical protein